MKKLKLILLTLLLATSIQLCTAQESINSDNSYRIMRLINWGPYLSTSGGKPYIHHTFNLHVFIYAPQKFNFAMEGDFIEKRHDTKLTGWKATPINASYYLLGDPESSIPFLLAGLSASYLWNNNKTYKNGMLLSPHVTFDVGFATIKASYDHDFTNKVGQFGISIQLSLTGIPYVLLPFLKYNN